MKIEDIKDGQPVVYIPEFLLGNKIKHDQLGVVSSKNDTYVFVKYLGSGNSQATKPEDLYPIHNRPDLKERLGVKLDPSNKLDEIYLSNKKI